MIGVVIVSYRSDDRTVRFVREELSRIRTEYRAVVVANGSSPEMAEELEKRLEGITVLPSENVGYARGNNLGAEWLRTCFNPEFILFTNNDIHFLSDPVVERLADKLSTLPGAGAIGPEVIGNDGLRQSPEPYMGMWKRYVWMYLLTPFLSKERKRSLFGLDYPQQAGEGFHYKLMGSFLMVRAEDFFRCGMFDPHTFLYAEENILSERLAAVGKRCYYYPGVTVLHDHGVTVKAHMDRRKSTRLELQSMSYYYRTYRHVSSLSAWIAGGLFQVFQLFR